MEEEAEAAGAALAGVHGEKGRLTPQSHVSIDYFDPPRDLRRFITTLFHFRCDDAYIHDIQPADVGKFMIVLKGRGQALFQDGRVQDIPPVSLQSPTSVALPFHFVDGLHSVGAALSPLGWAALSGLGADKHGNRLFDATELLGTQSQTLIDTIAQAYRSPAFDQAAMIDRVSGFLRKHMKRVSSRHAVLVEQVIQWLGTSLDPKLDALYAQSSYSTRQTQRLVERYFGLNPRALKRKHRAVRAAAILSAPHLSAEREAAVHDYFYDQSHLIREIGLFVGRTPSRLGEGDKPILNELLDLRNFRVRHQIDPGEDG